MEKGIRGMRGEGGRVVRTSDHMFEMEFHLWAQKQFSTVFVYIVHILILYYQIFDGKFITSLMKKLYMT